MSNFASNNKYFSCPPRMNDGRHFTSYKSSIVDNLKLQCGNGNQNRSSQEYRMFLTHKADNVLNNIRIHEIKKNGCYIYNFCVSLR